MGDIAGNHIVIYYDAEMKQADGLGWCVELLPSLTTHRFATLADAQLFITDNSWHFMSEVWV